MIKQKKKKTIGNLYEQAKESWELQWNPEAGFFQSIYNLDLI